MDSQSSGTEVVTIDVHAAKELLNSGYRYLDVRMKEDFDKGHVGNALNIPYYLLNTPEARIKNPKFMELVLSACTKEDGLVVSCGTGTRALLATTDLVNAGFKSAYHMGGGYKAWVENGFDHSCEEVRG